MQWCKQTGSASEAFYSWCKQTAGASEAARYIRILLAVSWYKQTATASEASQYMRILLVVQANGKRLHSLSGPRMQAPQRCTCAASQLLMYGPNKL